MPISFQSRRRPSPPAPAACARTRQPRGPCTISSQPVCISRTCERGGYQHLRGGEAKNLVGLLIRKSIRTPGVAPLPSDGLRGPPSVFATSRQTASLEGHRWPHTTTAVPCQRQQRQARSPWRPNRADRVTNQSARPRSRIPHTIAARSLGALLGRSPCASRPSPVPQYSLL